MNEHVIAWIENNFIHEFCKKKIDRWLARMSDEIAASIEEK